MNSEEVARSLLQMVGIADPEQQALRTILSMGSPPAAPPAPPGPPPLPPRPSSGTPDEMEQRVTRLETHMEYVRRDLDDLKSGQNVILERLSKLDDIATKSDLRTFRWQWLATAAAAIAIIIGGIIGGLGWIKPEATPSAPTIIQVPSTAPLQRREAD